MRLPWSFASWSGSSKSGTTGFYPARGSTNSNQPWNQAARCSVDRRDEFSVWAGAAVVRVVEVRTIKLVVVYYDGHPLGRVNCFDVEPAVRSSSRYDFDGQIGVVGPDRSRRTVVGGGSAWSGGMRDRRMRGPYSRGHVHSGESPSSTCRMRFLAPTSRAQLFDYGVILWQARPPHWSGITPVCRNVVI